MESSERQYCAGIYTGKYKNGEPTRENGRVELTVETLGWTLGNRDGRGKAAGEEGGVLVRVVKTKTLGIWGMAGWGEEMQLNGAT